MTIEEKYAKVRAENAELKADIETFRSKNERLDKDSKKAFEKRDAAIKSLKESESKYKPQIEAFEKSEAKRLTDKYGDKLKDYQAYKEKNYDDSDIDKLLGVKDSAGSTPDILTPTNIGVKEVQTSQTSNASSEQDLAEANKILFDNR